VILSICHCSDTFFLVILQTLFPCHFEACREILRLLSLSSCALSPHYPAVAHSGKDSSTTLRLMPSVRRNDKVWSIEITRWKTQRNDHPPLVILSVVRHCVPSVRRRIPSVYRTPFVVLRGGKGNRHCGHRSRGTYALTLLTPPKQRTVLFGKCGVRPSASLHFAQDDRYTHALCHSSDTFFLVILQTLFSLSFRSLSRNLATFVAFSCALSPYYPAVAHSGKDSSTTLGMTRCEVSE
jgi:hypothetical protein